MRNIISASILFLCFLIPAFAGSQTGQVTSVQVRASDGLIIVFLSGTPSGRPACATISYWMIKNENSVAGKQQLAQLLTARATGQVITIVGSNTCSRWADGEDIDLIVF